MFLLKHGFKNGSWNLFSFSFGELRVYRTLEQTTSVTPSLNYVCWFFFSHFSGPLCAAYFNQTLLIVYYDGKFWNLILMPRKQMHFFEIYLQASYLSQWTIYSNTLIKMYFSSNHKTLSLPFGHSLPTSLPTFCLL